MGDGCARKNRKSSVTDVEVRATDGFWLADEAESQCCRFSSELSDRPDDLMYLTKIDTLGQELV